MTKERKYKASDILYSSCCDHKQKHQTNGDLFQLTSFFFKKKIYHDRLKLCAVDPLSINLKKTKMRHTVAPRSSFHKDEHGQVLKMADWRVVRCSWAGADTFSDKDCIPRTLVSLQHVMNPEENKKRKKTTDRLVRKLTLVHLNQRFHRRSLRLQLLSHKSLRKSTVVMKDEHGHYMSRTYDTVLLLSIEQDMCIHPWLKIVPNKLTFYFFSLFE